MTVGMAIQATTGLNGPADQTPAGIGVLAAWAGGALLLGANCHARTPRPRDA